MRPLALLAAAALASAAAAQTVDSTTAQDLARQFFATHTPVGGPHRAPAQAEPILAYTATTDGTPDLYIFNRAADAPGFVIINADGTTDTPILGYSNTTTYNPDTAPAALRWWLQQYQVYGPAKAPARAGATIPIGTIGPLITTTWNQETPYNNAIPHGPFYPFVTGCTPTAVAQIMNHHQWPITGQGSQSYTVTYNGTTPITYEADFAATTYDWANMLPDYSDSYTTDQANAVATLMYHVGVASGTLYSDKDNGSQTDDRHASEALVRNFRYDPSMLRAERQYVTDGDWFNILYNEVRNGRPVLYSGTTTADEGHSFICDGYDNGLFHFNWGWGSTSDGYFAITGADPLRPGDHGIGGAPSGQGFTQHQSITYNILPYHGGTPEQQIAHDNTYFIAYDGAGYTSYAVNVAQGDKYLNLFFNPYNYGLNTANVLFGLRLSSSKNTITIPLRSYDLEPGSKFQGYLTPEFSTADIPADGTYTITPVYRDNNNAKDYWHELLPFIDSAQQPTITLTLTNVAQRTTPVVPQFAITGITAPSGPIFTQPTDFTLNLQVTNATGAALAEPYVYYAIDTDSGLYRGVVGYGDPIPAGYNATLPINLNTTKILADITPGRIYTLRFYSDSEHHHPLNIPTYQFLYAPQPHTISTLTSLIRELRGGRGTLDLLPPLRDNILKEQ